MPFPLFAVLTAVFMVATGTVSYLAARKAQKAAKRNNDEQSGVLVNKESNIEQIPVIYGERRVGGVRVFVSTDGVYKTVGGNTNWYSGYHPDTEVYDDVTGTPTNDYLYIALVLAEGEVESVTDLYLDDLPSTDAKYSGLVSWNVYLGTDNQTMPDTALLREANEFWTADHRLRGVAFIGVRLTWDEEAFAGVPDITAVVKGRKLYDPRTTTTVWSDNPALCIRDYLTNTRYGKGLPVSAIDDVAIAAAANACDESVTLYDGGGSGKLFTTNVVLDTSKSLFDNLNILLLGCRGFLPYSQGQYRLKIDGSRSSEFTFTTDTIIGGIAIKGESKEDKFNRVTVKFPNPDANWQPDTAIWPPAGSTEETTYLAEDGGVLLHEEIELDAITNYYQARDLARVILLRSRNAITCAIKTTSEALQLEVADVVSITHPTPGWTAKPFQVVGMQLAEDGTVDLALLEYDSTIYTWEEGTEQTAYPDTSLPDPFTVGTVSNITITETTTLGEDGTVIPTGFIQWDASYDNLVNNYELQYKLTSEADSEFKSLFSSLNKYEFYNAEVGVSVTIRIRAINSLNVKGAFTTATFTINGDTTAPNAPTGLVATAGIKNIRLDWTNPSAKDLKIIDVYRHTSNSSGSASKIASINSESFVDQNIAADTTYYYWLKAADYSENVSGFSGVASASATLVTSAGIVDGSIDVAKFAAGIEPVSLVTSVPATKSTETIYNTTDNLLYRWDGTQYVSAVGVSDFSGLTGQLAAGQAAVNSIQSAAIQASAITETKVGTNAITAAKIQSGAVIAGKIGALAVTANEIAANTITSAKIAANTITANQIATGTITANEILANTITAGQIAAGAISATELAADSVSVAKLVSNTSKSYGNFQFEFGTSTSVAGFTGAGILRGAQANAFGVAGLGNGDPCVAVVGQQSYNGADSYGAYFANSLFLGGTTHRSQAGLCNNTRAGIFAAGTKAVSLANSTYAVETTGNVYVNGNITATGTITPFTGMHDGLLDDSITPEIGDIMVDTEVLIKRDVSNTLCLQAISSQPNQAAIGVYSEMSPANYVPVSARSPTPEKEFDEIDDISPENLPTRDPQYDSLFVGRNCIVLNSVGEGQVNVCGEGGDIQAGDLIVTSSTLGKGMKQGDDIIRSYTVAKAREAATFQAGEVKMISCIYLCG